MLIGLASCISETDILPMEESRKYVIEGSIETGKPARVLITRTLPFFESVYTADLLDIVVQEARVFVSCEDQSEELFLIRDKILPDVPVYHGSRIKGQPGKVYSLEVRIGEEVFRSEERMQAAIHPEKLWFSLASGSDSMGFVNLDILDPGATANYYRIWARRVGKDSLFQPVNQDILNDYYFNGSYFSLPLMMKGNLVFRPDTSYFRKGETVVVKLAHITASFYEVITNAKYESDNLANPFAIHFEAFSNIQGGAIGGWGCYSVALDTLYIE